MLLIFLTIVLFLLFLFIYVVCDKDIFTPSVLFALSYFVSSICCLWNAARWGTDLDFMTFMLIVISVFSFFLGDATIRSIRGYRPHLINEYNKGEIKQQKINISIWIVLLVIAYDLLMTYLLYKEVVRIASLNFASWGNLIYNFKTNSNNMEGAAVSSLVTQGLKLSKAFGYLFAYIFINNYFASRSDKKRKINVLYLVPVIIVIIQSLLKGVRVAILTLLIAMIFMWYVNMQINKGWNWHIKLKQLSRIGLLLIVVCTMFYYSKGLVGRLQDDMGVVTYATTYLGGPIELLNQFVEKGVQDNSNVIETMGGLISSLQKLGLFKNAEIHAIREYRSTVTGIDIGNVYGAVRDYYHDFGFFGVPVCFYLVSLLVNSMFYKIKKRGDYNLTMPTLLIVFSTFVYAIIFLTFSDFLTAKLALGELIEIACIIVVVRIILRPAGKKIKIGSIRI